MTPIGATRRPPQAVIVGTAGDPRVAGYQAARARAGLAPAALLDYRDLIADPEGAAARLRAPARVRIESPGRDPQVLAGLLVHGITTSARLGLHHWSRDEIARQAGERGRLLPPRQLYFGMAHVLEALAARAREPGTPPAIALVPDIATILRTFDKTACHRHLAAAGVPVPQALPSSVASFEALIAAMQAARLARVFVKLQHGSAAAGTVALATSRLGMSAVTTVEQVPDADGVRLYNTRALRRHTSPAEIARLVDALAPHGLHVEAWIPKAGIDGRIVDLRVVTVAGEPVFRVLRRSRHPITNLHLGGERADAAGLLARMSARAAAALDQTCRAVARAMPGALQLGIDIAVAAGLARHYVLEVNAFGDLLKGVTDRQGLDPYDVQLRAMEQAA
jgi:glutathione synthase/RimK-type ligase-like ATP-grasp enzyme